MAFVVATLASRASLTAADGSPVVGTQLQGVYGTALYVEFSYTTTGTPATINVRCGIDGSLDGTNWQQLIRFVDQTTVGGAKRVARMPGSAAAVEAAVVAADLTAAAASATLADGTIPYFVRCTTMLQALTGGASPTVSITVKAMATN